MRMVLMSCKLNLTNWGFQRSIYCHANALYLSSNHKPHVFSHLRNYCFLIHRLAFVLIFVALRIQIQSPTFSTLFVQSIDVFNAFVNVEKAIIK